MSIEFTFGQMEYDLHEMKKLKMFTSFGLYFRFNSIQKRMKIFCIFLK